MWKDAPILATLLDPIYLQGQCNLLRASFGSDPINSWILLQNTPYMQNRLDSAAPDPSLFKSVQSKALNVLSRRDRCESLA